MRVHRPKTALAYPGFHKAGSLQAQFEPGWKLEYPATDAK